MDRENTGLTRVLAKLETLLDRYVDTGAEQPRFAEQAAYRWDAGRRCLQPIKRVVRVDRNDLLGIDAIKSGVESNTRQFINGRKANNVLLWGERGTGKSSLVKSLLATFAGTGLRMIQVYKHDILTIQDLYAHLAGKDPYRFILFIDDLSFEETQADYKEMKTIIDGGLEEVPENILFYATSNRKHLMPTKFSDNDGDEVRPSDTVEEKVSLVDRFGLRFGFYHFSQETYLEIAANYAKQYGVRIDPTRFERGAVQWATAAGGRNGRVAEQFVRSLLDDGTTK